MAIVYGAHCYLFTERWSDDDLALLETARSLGLGVWEIAVGDDVRLVGNVTRGDTLSGLGTAHVED